jgi:predicted dehydrogenase
MVGIGLVGYGYWGPNLARNFAVQANCRLVAICELHPERARLASQRHAGTLVTNQYAELLGHPDIQAIVLATPMQTHFALARQALLAGKDVLVEKPMTRTAAEAEALVHLARQNGRILAVDHTFLFTDAVRNIKELVDSGALGKLLYMDSVRTNLGLFHPEYNVIWDLAPHEISIVLHLCQHDPIAVQAQGACHTNNAVENLAYIHLELSDGFIAHFHLNWLAPVKIRQTILAGSRQMVVYDDMNRTEKIKIYNKGIAVRPADDVDAHYKAAINYRMGDMVAPHLPNQEALAVEAAHFVDCVANRKPPLVPGEDGLRVVRILEAAQCSLQNHGQRVELQPAPRRSQAA